MDTSDFTSAAWSQLPAIPLYLTLLAGLVAAIFTWRRHRAASLLAALAFVLMIALTFISRIVYAVSPRLASETGWTPQQVGAFYSVYGFVHMAVESVAWILVIVALFAWRTGAPRIEPPSRRGPHGDFAGGA